jgi:hypothetical protein
MKNNRLPCFCLAAAFLLGTAAMRPVGAEEAHGKSLMNINGTYLLDQADGKKQILSLTRDGLAFSQNSGQFDPPSTFGNQQGVWARSGQAGIVIKTLDFTTDPGNNNSFNGYGLSTFQASLNENGELAGTVTVEIFPSNVDPLASGAIPSNTFGPIDFTSQRLLVGPGGPR